MSGISPGNGITAGTTPIVSSNASSGGSSGGIMSIATSSVTSGEGKDNDGDKGGNKSRGGDDGGNDDDDATADEGKATLPPRWVVVYIEEAHAADEWPISSARYAPNGEPVNIPQHTRRSERLRLARRLQIDFALPPTMPVAAVPLYPFRSHVAPLHVPSVPMSTHSPPPSLSSVDPVSKDSTGDGGGGGGGSGGGGGDGIVGGGMEEDLGGGGANKVEEGEEEDGEDGESARSGALFDRLFKPWPTRWFVVDGDGRLSFTSRTHDASFDLRPLRDHLLQLTGLMPM